MKAIKLFIGMILFIPEFIIALFVKLGALLPAHTFTAKGASKLAGDTIDVVTEMFVDIDEEEEPKPRTQPKSRAK